MKINNDEKRSWLAELCYISRIMMILMLLLTAGISNAFSGTYSQITLLSLDINKQSVKEVSAEEIMSVMNSEQQPSFVRGKVTDHTGEPLVGVSVIIQGIATGVITDINGDYSINVASGKTLVFSYIGYKNVSVQVKNQPVVNIVLEEDVQSIGEVVVVGYGTQAKATLTGAVSAIKGSDMISTKNENAQNMLTGKVPGVRVTQKTAEPGAFDNNFDIRGMGSPLVVIDGIPRTVDDFQRLDPNDIENLSVLKDASAAIYGVRAANGVVLVTTKKGTANMLKPELSYSGTYTFQVPSGLPSTLDAVGYMTLRNERNMH
ncbi:TonB-dependent receptor SusC, partial [termite gut metagenome]